MPSNNLPHGPLTFQQVLEAIMKRWPTLTEHGAGAIILAVGKPTAYMLTVK